MEMEMVVGLVDVIMINHYYYQLMVMVVVKVLIEMMVE
jgi:hypothetical protein